MRYFYIGILIIITFQVSYSQENRENNDFLTDKMPRVLKDWDKLIEQYNVQSPFLKGNPVHINKGRLTGGGKLVQKNLVDDPVTIRRFTKSIAHEYWGNDKNIFAQVYGIMIMPTPVGRLLFACDPIWSRIMWTVQGSIDIPGFGSYGTGPGQFKDPRDIAGKYPNLFIADPWNHRVPHYKVVIDSLQTPFGTWIKYVKEIQFIQNIGEGFLYLPFGLDYSDNGTPENIEDDLIYVADAGSSFIAKFSIDGDLISTYGKWGSGYGEFWHPGDVAVGKDMGVNTEDIFVLDYANARVVKYPHIDPNSPNFYFLTYQWPNTSTFHIRSIAVDYFGFPYVSDSEDRIVKYQIDLSDTLWSYGTHGFGDGHFNEIIDIYILQDELVATERWTNNSGISYYWIEAIPPDTIPPYAKIHSPPDKTYVNGVINILGTVTDNQYIRYWTLYYGEGITPINWILIDFGTGSKEEEVLTTWDTSVLEEGLYSILLEGVDGANNKDWDTIRVWVGEPPQVLVIGARGHAEGQFRLPVDVTVDENGYIYVADTQNDRIQKFTHDGTFVLTFGKHGMDPGKFKQPSSVGIMNGELYVVDMYNDRVQVFDLDGNYSRKFGSKGEGNGQFNHPGGVAFDIDHFVYVSDMHNHRIQRFDQFGNYQSSFGLYGTNDGELNQPTGITVIDSLIYVADRQNNRAQRFSLCGTHLQTIGEEGYEPGQFKHPYDIVVDSDSCVYVADVHNNRVQKFDKYGFRLLTFNGVSDSLKLSCGLGIDGEDATYIADTHNNRVVKFKQKFSLLEFIHIPKSFSVNQNYPNPFSSFTKISYAVPGANPSGTSQVHSFNVSGFSGFTSVERKISLRIYNVNGQLVRVLVDKSQKSGYYTVGWDGRNLNKKQVTSGIYFYRLKIDNFVATGKMVIFR